MKIIATLLVRDEEDIIAENLEHHLKHGVSNFIVTNHNSTDNTLAIIKSYPQVLQIIEKHDEAYLQWSWVTQMAKMAAEYNPDWIVHLDADEFWYGFEILAKVPSNIALIKSSSSLTPSRSNGLSCREFRPLNTYELLEKFHKEKYQYYITSQHRPLKGCKIVHRPTQNITVFQGNHDASIDGQHGFTNQIKIDHYPIRSYAHFEKKVKNGGEAYAKSTTLDRSLGTHWKRWYQIYLQGNLKKEFESLSIDPNQIPKLLTTGELFDKNKQYPIKPLYSWSKPLLL
jgi:hypothetical protein